MYSEMDNKQLVELLCSFFREEAWDLYDEVFDILMGRGYFFMPHLLIIRAAGLYYEGRFESIVKAFEFYTNFKQGRNVESYEIHPLSSYNPKF